MSPRAPEQREPGTERGGRIQRRPSPFSLRSASILNRTIRCGTDFAQSSTRLITNEQVTARIEELKRTICAGVVCAAIRDRSTRVQILQDNLDRMRDVIVARAFEYADHFGGSTGMLVKDYRGKNAEKAVLRFDAALVAQMNDTLKQAAIEEGQWTEKREPTATNINAYMDNINAGRKRVADAKLARDRAAAEEA